MMFAYGPAFQRMASIHSIERVRFRALAALADGASSHVRSIGQRHTEASSNLVQLIRHDSLDARHAKNQPFVTPAEMNMV